MISDISPIKASHINAFYELDSSISKAIEFAKDQGVPQGLIVSIIHAHSTKETLKMIGVGENNE